LPLMYQMGYKNNNCVGCVKGGKGYWNKIRNDFPDVFANMVRIEEQLGHTILSDTINGASQRLFLKDLDPTAGNYSTENHVECGIFCEYADSKYINGNMTN